MQKTCSFLSNDILVSLHIYVLRATCYRLYMCQQLFIAAFPHSLLILKIYSICNVHYKFSVLAVNIGTQSICAVTKIISVVRVVRSRI